MLRMLFVFVCIFALLSPSFGIEYTNYQLAQKTTNRLRWTKTTLASNSISVVGCTNRYTCESLNQVDPIWKFRNNYIADFTPTTTGVLISYAGDDTIMNQEWNRYSGIVVSVGTGVASPSIKIGQRVYFSDACVAKWTTASWTAIYGQEKAAAMNGKLVNGVDLNNGGSWGGAKAVPAARSWTAATWGVVANEPSPSKTSQADAGTPVTFDDQFWYPGASGASWWPSSAANTDVFREALPMDNPGQQANYLLCSEAQIYGTVSQDSFSFTDTTHYVKASTVFEASKRFFAFGDSSHFNGGVSNNQRDARKVGTGVY